MTHFSARSSSGIGARRRSTRGVVVALALCAFSLAANAGDWPESSKSPLHPLNHATLEERVQALGPRLDEAFGFVAFGDQRALADGEWQAMMRHIAVLDQDESNRSPLLFLLDTGDMVSDGSHSDQFGMLRNILSPVRQLPYFLAPGNHELHNESDPRARRNLVRFLGLQEQPDVETPLHREIRYGSLRILIVDSNLLVYQRPKETDDDWERRANAELTWLRERLAEDEEEITTIVALHHPLIQTSKKHSGSSRKLWSRRVDGVQLPQMLLDGGVDVILCGHTHTYEAYRLSRGDGHHLWHINISGRPRNSFLWFGSGARRAHDIRGKELEWLADKDYEDLEGWTIEQVEVMDDYELNQFAVFTVEADGRLDMRIVYVGREDNDAMAPQPVRTLVPR